MNHLILCRIMILRRKKLGSTEDLNFTSRIKNAECKTEFANNSLNSPKIGKLNIDPLIIPQGLSINEKNQSTKISCYSPFKIHVYGTVCVTISHISPPSHSPATVPTMLLCYAYMSISQILALNII